MKNLTLKLTDIVQLENSRAKYRETELSDLMENIKQNGLLHPVGVRKLPRSNKYELVYGNRRYAAYKKLGKTTIEARLMESSSTSKIDNLLVNIAENNQRKDVPAAEQGRIFHQLVKMGLTPSEIASRCNVAKRLVENSITCYKNVPAKFRDKVVNNMSSGLKKGRLNAETATAIVNMKKTFRLGKVADKLFDYAKQDGVSRENVVKVASLLGRGYKLDEAIEKADELKVLTLKVTMKKGVIERLEKKHGKPITQLLTETLLDREELQVIQPPTFRAGRKERTTTVVGRKTTTTTENRVH